MPSIPEPPDTLTDGVVSLRLYAERDIPEILIAYQDDPRLHEQVGQARPPSGAELGSEADRADAERASGQRVRLTILEPGSSSPDTCVGRVWADEFDWDNSGARLHVWVAPAARRRGLGRAAAVLASRWLFASCRLQRIAAYVDPSNGPAIGAAAAAGFPREGLLRAYESGRRGRRDMVAFSLIPGDLG